MSRRSESPHRGASRIRLPGRTLATKRRHLTVSLALGLALSATSAFGLPTAAGATTSSKLQSAKAQAEQLQAEIDVNSQKADVLDEQYLQDQQAVADANQRITAAEKSIAKTEAHAAGLRSQLGQRAAMLYMGADSTDPMGLDVTSVQDLGSRAKYGEAAAAEATQMLGDLKVTDEQLHLQQQDLEHQRADAQKRANDAAAARQQVAALNAKMQQLLSSTNAKVRALASQLATEQAAAAARAEQARLQRLAAEQAAIAASTRHISGTGGGGGGGIGGAINIDPSTIPAPSAGAQAAVAYAFRQIGKPYQYAGTGPGSYDCSGLTMMAWAQGGVSMAHGSQSQYDSFPHVPISDLKPGDLVFFGVSGPANHHVGIVVGPGVMIDAPHTGAYVEEVSYYRPDLVPLGARP